MNRIPGFAAEASLCGVAASYVHSHNNDPSDGQVAPAQGWGYSHFPTYPGQRCIMKRREVYLCVTDPTSGRVIWCGNSLQGECVYPIIPQPLPFWPLGPSEH